MRITGSRAYAIERDRSGLGESIIRMTDRVLSNMDVTTSRGQCVGSYSFVLSGVLEDNLKPHM